MDEKETMLSRYAHETEASLPDVDVIRRAVDGDEDAFGELFHATYRRMFFVARHILSRDEDIYDALQIAYSKAYRYIGRVSPLENFYAWLAKIVENSAKDVWRDLHPNEELTAEIEDTPTPDVSEDADRRVMVARVLKEMDPRRAEVLALYYYDGLKFTEIAKLLGEPISTVHSRLKAAKRELTDLLAQRGIDRSFYSGGCFSAIAVALRSVLGTDLLSAAVAQKMMDEVLSGKPGRLDVAAAKLAEKQRNKAILRVVGLLLLLVFVVALLTSALVNGWFIHREKPTGAPTAPTTMVLGVVSDGTTTTASTTVLSADETTTVGGSETTVTLPTNDGTTTAPSETIGVTTPSASVTTEKGTGSTSSTTTTRPTAPNGQSTTTTTTTKPTTTTTTTKPTTTRPTTPPNDISDKLTYIVMDSKAVITDCDKSVSGAVAIPASLGGVPVVSIKANAFSGCDGITSITLPNTLTTIGAQAFADCCELRSIVLPDSVTTVGQKAFNGCYLMESIVLGTGVRSFDTFALVGCGSLKSITVRAGNTTYHSDGDCLILTAKKKLVAGSLDSVIPDDGSVTTIGEAAFQWLDGGIQTITIPDSITYIEQMAFSYVKNLYITDLKAWCNITFADDGANPMRYAQNIYINGEKVTGKLVVPRGVTTIKEYTFAGCTMIQVELPEGVSTIESGAFAYCKNLMAVSLPKSVKMVDSHAFHQSSEIATVTYAGSVSDRAAIAGLANCEELKNTTWNYNA